MIINEQTLREALNADEGTWKEMPFPTDHVPEGCKVRSIQGTVKGCTFLTVAYNLSGSPTAYDGTFTCPPVTLGRLPETLSKEAFLKGLAWLAKQNPAA